MGVRVRGADTTMGGDDEATQLAEAARLPWEERFKHSFWKARVAE